MAEHEIFWASVVAALLEPIEVAARARLADNEPFSGLASVDLDRDPVAMLIAVGAYVAPFDGAGLALAHA